MKPSGVLFALTLSLSCGALEAPAQKPLSEASRRAIERGYDQIGAEHHVAFKQSPLKGDFAYDPDVIRRDPSAVIKVAGLYYAWYTRCEATEVVGFGSDDPNDKAYPWDLAEVWYATSPDGWTWREQGLAIGRGPTGAYDDRAVLTPEILRHDGRYYLVYQTVKAPYQSRTKNEVGMAIADRPAGPWKKLDKPILSPSDTGKWRGDVDDRSQYLERGEFDSHKIHDPTLFYFRGKFYLYYKGQRVGEELAFGGREINHGVAIADRPEGPYVRSEYNPISNSGHEIAMWPYRGGMAALLTTDGPEKDTLQWSPDGVNFFIKARLKETPKALGIYRYEDDAQNENHPAGLPWGLAHRYHGPSRNSITRYDVYQPVLKDPGLRKAQRRAE